MIVGLLDRNVEDAVWKEVWGGCLTVLVLVVAFYEPFVRLGEGGVG
jgi:hypothetical protein